jgi:hypothetical protein
VFLSGICTAQVTLLSDGSLPYDTSSNWLVEFNLGRSDLGNALEREMISKFIWGGEISSEVIDNSSGNLDASNLYLGELRGSFDLIKLRKEKRFSWLFSYSIRDQISVEFTSDFYQMLFRGNTIFGSKQANLGLSCFERYSYQQLSFGLVQRETGSFASIGLVHGFNYSNFTFDELNVNTLYETVDSYNIPVSVIAEAKGYESVNSNSLNGFGLVLNGAYNQRMSAGLISFRVNDLGFTSWNGIEKSDTSGAFTYNGFNWIYGEDNDVEGYYENLADSLNPSSRSESITQLLPFHISLEYFSKAEKKLFTSFIAEYRYVPNHLPSLTGRLNYRIREQFFVWVNGGIGGASQTSLGLGAQIGLGESLYLTLGSRHFGGVIDPRSTALSAYIRLQWQL